MDALQRGIDGERSLLWRIAVTTESVREACRRQQVTGVEAVVLGRAMTCGALLATLAKEGRERVRITYDGGGPTGRVLVDAHGDGRLRACLQGRIPAGHPGRQAIEHEGRVTTRLAVGRRGHLVVTRDLGANPPYQGNVALVSGEIDEDLEHYLAHSEQIPSALAAEVELDERGDVRSAAGILCQGFPGSDPEQVVRVRARIGAGHLRPLLAREPACAELVDFALGHGRAEGSYREAGTHALAFVCTCGPENVHRVLSSLGHEDLLRLADERDSTVVTCHFCGEATRVPADEVRALAHALRQGLS